MIFACPSCSASHFKPDAEVKAGVAVVCRRCRARFRVTAAGVEMLADESAPVAAPTAQATQQAEDVVPTTGGTAVLAEPSTTVSPVPDLAAASGLADALEPESADDLVQSIDFDEVSGGVAPAVDPSRPLELGHDTTGAESAFAASESAAPQPAPRAFDDGEPTASDPSPPQAESTEAFAAASTELASSDPSSDQPSDAPSEEPSPAMAAAEPDLSVDSGFTERTGIMTPSVMLSSPTDATRQISPDELPQVEEPRPSEQPMAATQPAPTAAAASEEHEEPAPRSTAEIERMVRRPTFPTAALGNYVRDWSTYFGASTVSTKVAVVISAMVPLALIALGVYALMKPRAAAAWIAEPAALWSGPADAYTQVDTLARGELLSVLERGEAFALVRDVWGRAGYVSTAALVEAPPSLSPESGFPGCRLAPIEASDEACKARAQSGFDSCREGCGDETPCVDRCTDRFLECLEGCKVRLSPGHEPAQRGVAAAAAPSDAPATAAAADPAAGTEPGAAKPEVTAPAAEPTAAEKAALAKKSKRTKKDTKKKTDVRTLGAKKPR